ncbi:cysteine desulfurase family protein [Schaalia sp. lx-100]|uniref:cysteine desulfurase family protein n=1 Tax=Schaalia sp. lx-100 TaxID=2899081 RepID=UPI001E58ACD1|nr:cysteine desulfurase family protein [Schaalia sp. lx-100]MCD4557959.1 cysteine desulfurase [Schaalia sp. lx-100]
MSSDMRQEHYLDHAATTPMPPHVIEAWTDAARLLAERPGNPASLHSGGRAARRLLEDARERIACALGADRAEVVFTSGATESDAIGVSGAARSVYIANPHRHRVLISSLEHDAVLEQKKSLPHMGLSCELLPVTYEGRTDVSVLSAPHMWDDIALVSMTYAASEVGTLQPVDELIDIRDRACALGEDHTPQPGLPLIHTDAAQAVTTCDLNFRELGCDLLSIGGHKIGAPVGIGALLIRRGISVVSDRPGGGHERGIRSGTPDVAGAVTFACALEYAVSERERARVHAEKLRDHLVHGLSHTCAGRVSLTVPMDFSLPTIIHLSLPTRHPEALLLAMDSAGVHVSAGSACHAGVTRPSEVLIRMGRSVDQALGVLRISTGKETSISDIDAFLAALPAALEAGIALDQLEGQK